MTRSTSRAKWPGALTLLGALLGFYLLMFLRYRPYEIDNPWFLSFSYDTFIEHIPTDQFMLVHFPAGMDGTQIFGRLAAGLQCLVLNPWGWQQTPAVVLSSGMVVLALGLWWLQLRRLGYSPVFCRLFVLALGLSEPCLSAANKFRYEFFSFALISLGLLLVAYGAPLLGMFTAAMAAETEPLALAGILAVIVLVHGTSRWTTKTVLRLACGLALAAVCYLLLHPHGPAIVSTAPHAPSHAGLPSGGFFVSYFFRRVRHVPELLCFLAAAVVYWRRRPEQGGAYFGWGALLLTVYALVMPHGNPAYMIFVFPFLVGMLLCAFRAERAPWLTVVLLSLYCLPQAVGLVYLTRSRGFRAQDIQQVSSAIADASRRLKIDDRDLRIYGDYRLWFAHPHGYRAAAESTRSAMADADLYLCFDQQPDAAAMAPKEMLTCPQIAARMPLRPISTILLRNNLLHLYSR